jgi:hypothetical protein
MTTNTTSRRSAEQTRVLILAALAEATAPLTVSDLADQAGVAKSTVSRHLPVLERDGEAARTPGGREGRRRLPDQWTLTATTVRDNDAQETASAEPVADAEPVCVPAPGENTTRPEAAPDTDPEQVASADADADSGEGHQGTATEVAGDADADAAIPGFGTVAQAELDALSARATGTRVQEPWALQTRAGAVPRAAVPLRTALPRSGATRIGARAEAEANPVSGSTRLAPGELKLMVRAILDADPDEEFTATAISHILQGRSIGAIQNNLARLATEGHAVQTCDKPRRYQSAKGTS